MILVVVLACGALALVSSTAPGRSAARVQTLTFSYTAHDGAARTAYLVLPAWYGPDRTRRSRS